MGDVVDDEVGVGSRRGDVIPVVGDAVGRQVEVDRGDGGDGVHAQGFGVAGQLLGVGGVVAGHMGDDGHLAAHLGHDVLQNDLPLGHALVDALAGGAAHIQALDALFQQIFGQSAGAGGADGAVVLVAGVERREHALVLFDIRHSFAQILSKSFPGESRE